MNIPALNGNAHHPSTNEVRFREHSLKFRGPAKHYPKTLTFFRQIESPTRCATNVGQSRNLQLLIVRFRFRDAGTLNLSHHHGYQNFHQGMHVPLLNIPSANLGDLVPMVLAMMDLRALQLSIKQSHAHLFCRFHRRLEQVANHLGVDGTKLSTGLTFGLLDTHHHCLEHTLHRFQSTSA